MSVMSDTLCALVGVWGWDAEPRGVIGTLWLPIRCEAGVIGVAIVSIPSCSCQRVMFSVSVVDIVSSLS